VFKSAGEDLGSNSVDQLEMLVIGKHRGPTSSGQGGDPDIVCRYVGARFTEHNHDFGIDAGCIVIYIEDFYQRMAQKAALSV